MPGTCGKRRNQASGDRFPKSVSGIAFRGEPAHRAMLVERHFRSMGMFRGSARDRFLPPSDNPVYIPLSETRVDALNSRVEDKERIAGSPEPHRQRLRNDSMQPEVFQVEYRRDGRARRLKLQIRDGNRIRVVVPPNVSLLDAKSFVDENREWIAGNLDSGPDISDPDDFHVEYRRDARARKYLIRIRSGNRVRVTIPSHGSLAQAKKILEQNRQRVLDKLKSLRKPAQPPPVAPVGNPVEQFRDYKVEYRRNSRALRYWITIRSRDHVILTIPRGGSQRKAVDFLERQRGWIERQLKKKGDPARQSRWNVGGTVWFRGNLKTVEKVEGGVRIGDLFVPLVDSTGDLKDEITGAMRQLAERELPGLIARKAREMRIAGYGKVTIRDQRGLWGSCTTRGSTRGNISLNWRLMQMPPGVCEYVVYHELAHLRHPNHSRSFWQLVESYCPDHLKCRDWINKQGDALMER